MINKYTLVFILLAIAGLAYFFWQRSPLKSSALYKIVPAADFDKTNKKNCVKLSTLDKQDGFIHAAYGNQVERIVAKFFKNETKLLFLELDLNELQKNGTNIRPEPNKPGGTIFPHLYGTQKIPLSAVKKIISHN